MSRILYRERIEDWADSPTRRYVCDYVEVEVRSWTCQGMTPDVVRASRVMVDRKLVVDARTVYPHNEADAHYIRAGIARFDELLENHPTLSNRQEAVG